MSDYPFAMALFGATLMGIIVSVFIFIDDADDIGRAAIIMKAECEAEIPRKQQCIMQYIPEEK